MAENRIRALRKERGYNQKELGELLGVGQTTVSAWEIGRNEPDNESSHKMAKLFGCSIGYLMGFESESAHRGLSDKEWAEFTEQQHQKRQEREQIRRIEQIQGQDDEEIERYLENEETAKLRKKLLEGSEALYPETYQVDIIFDRLNAEERERVVRVLEAAYPPKSNN